MTRLAFTDKVAVVTGGAQGIGRACVLALARDGAAVVIADRDMAASRAIVDGITSWGGRAFAVIADVSDENDTAHIATEAVAAFGGVDVLINAAGVECRGSVESTPLDVWNRTLAVNLTGVYLVSRFVLPEMRRRGGGAIVHIASLHGLATTQNIAAYAASKGGVIALTRSMALDYAQENIRVNCVCPSDIDTPLLRDTVRNEVSSNVAAVLHELGQQHPLKRIGTPEEVAEVVLFLASERASFTTGSIYTVDGGLGAGF